MFVARSARLAIAVVAILVINGITNVKIEQVKGVLQIRWSHSFENHKNRSGRPDRLLVNARQALVNFGWYLSIADCSFKSTEKLPTCDNRLAG